jgi:hypothetical protein
MEKAEAITLDKARELVGDAALWPRMRDFLWDFAPQVHESWMESLKVEGSTIQSPRVKAYILESLGVEPFFHDFPKDDWSRLALLDGATLLEIAKWLGALACAGELRRVTNGATVRELKTALRGVYPEVFGFTAYFVKDVKELGGLVVGWLGGEGADMKLNADFVVGVGYSLLHAAVAHLPDPLRQRLRLKLPKNITTKLPNHEATKLPNLQLLLKLRFPEAYSLCCS